MPQENFQDLEKGAVFYPGTTILAMAAAKAYREKEYIGAGLKASRCVLNVARELIEDKQGIVFLEDYELRGALSTDPRVIHPPHSRILEITGYQSHASRFNFSLVGLKDVKVLPEGGGKPLPKRIWRTYNLIADSELHIRELMATLSEDTFEILQLAGVMEEKAQYQANGIYNISLEGMPLVSPCWAQPGIMRLVDLMKEEKELTAEQTEVNARVKELGGPKEEENEDVYYEQSQPVSEPLEYYEANCIEYRLMHYKAQMYNYSEASLEQCLSRIKEIRSRLRTIRWITRSIIFAYETKGKGKIIGWDEPRTRRGKEERLARFQEVELKRVAWTEQVARTPRS